MEAVTVEQARTAHYAWRRYGKSNDAGGLNFGDCFANALAEATREPPVSDYQPSLDTLLKPFYDYLIMGGTSRVIWPETQEPLW